MIFQPVLDSGSAAAGAGHVGALDAVTAKGAVVLVLNAAGCELAVALQRRIRTLAAATQAGSRQR